MPRTTKKERQEIFERLGAEHGMHCAECFDWRVSRLTLSGDLSRILCLECKDEDPVKRKGRPAMYGKHGRQDVERPKVLSEELRMNREREPKYRRWVFRRLKHCVKQESLRELKRLNSAACEHAGVSVVTGMRYMDRLISDTGPCELYPGAGDVRCVRLRSQSIVLDESAVTQRKNGQKKGKSNGKHA